MILVIAGIKRSASTGCYNMVRIALKQAGYKVNIHGQNYKPQKVPKGEVDIIKIHPFRRHIAKKANHIFLTDRNDIDILKSLDRMWGSGNPERIKGMRGDLEAWMKYPHHLFSYDEIVNEPLQTIRAIIRILGLDVNPESVLKEFNKIEPPTEKQDPVTLLFPNHISNE